MPNSLNVNTPNMLKQNTKLKSKNQNLEKNAVTWSRNTLHKITLLALIFIHGLNNILLVFITLLVLLKIKILLLNSKIKKRKLLAIANSLNLSI